MWSGGRSIKSVAVAVGIIGSPGAALSQTPLCNGQHPGNPALISGAASCVFNEVGGAGQTLITLNDTSIIRWDHFGLSNPASNLSFQWAGPAGATPAVLNRVEGGNAGRGGIAHHVFGNVDFPQGTLVVTNPNSSLRISGSVVSRALILSTHKLDPAGEQQLLNGQPADFTGAVHPLNVIDGQVIALDGDAVLAGRFVQHSSAISPNVNASEILSETGNVRIAALQNFRLNPSGQERIVPLPGAANGFLNNSKTIRSAQQVEISAASNIENRGLIEANRGGARVFLRVSNGDELIQNSGEILGFVTSSHPLTNEAIIIPNENDTPSPLSTGISRFPVVNRPGEKPSSKRVVVYENAPTTGSVSAQRERTNRRTANANTSNRNRNQQVASNTTATRGTHLARGRSFFGLRGGTRAKKR